MKMRAFSFEWNPERSFIGLNEPETVAVGLL